MKGLYTLTRKPIKTEFYYKSFICKINLGQGQISGQGQIPGQVQILGQGQILDRGQILGQGQIFGSWSNSGSMSNSGSRSMSVCVVASDFARCLCWRLYRLNSLINTVLDDKNSSKQARQVNIKDLKRLEAVEM